MAYTKTDWACGDKITAEKLNKIEQGIVDAQNGYECTETVTQLYFEDNVTTDAGSRYADAKINPTEFINADHIRVTIDGTAYECDRRNVGSGIQYGAPYDVDNDTFDFSEYPFGILSDSSECYFHTQTAGTYTIKIEVPEEVVNTTECFEKAVKSVANTEPLIISYLTSISSGTTNYTIYDKTAQEVQDAFNQGRPIYWKYSSDASYIPPTRIFFESADEGVEAGIVFLRDYEASKWELLETIIDNPSLPSALQPYINHLFTSEGGYN